MNLDAPERYDLAQPLDLQAAVLRCQRSALLFGASDLERSVIATIVSELGSNVLKYARRGTLEMRRLRTGLAADIEITARDQGPGIADVDLALTDHYSSSRSLGLGLPGVRRMADELTIENAPEGGTVVRARKRLNRSVSARTEGDGSGVRLVSRGDRWLAAAAVRTRSGHRTAGDAAAVVDRGTHVLTAIIDASGHGPVAHALAVALTNRLRSRFEAGPDPGDVAGLLFDLHEASVGTVGAAAGLAVIDTKRAVLRYLAVGNVRAAVIGARRFTGVSRDGVLGRRWPTPFVQQTTLTAGDTLLLWTDGLPEALARLHGSAEASQDDLQRAAPERVADTLLGRYARPHDDAACMVFRWRT